MTASTELVHVSLIEQGLLAKMDPQKFEFVVSRYGEPVSRAEALLATAITAEVEHEHKKASTKDKKGPNEKEVKKGAMDDVHNKLEETLKKLHQYRGDKQSELDKRDKDKEKENKKAQEIYGRYDIFNNDYVDLSLVPLMLREIGIVELSRRDMGRLLSQHDANDDKRLDLDEFRQVIRDKKLIGYRQDDKALRAQKAYDFDAMGMVKGIGRKTQQGVSSLGQPLLKSEGEA